MPLTKSWKSALIVGLVFSFSSCSDDDEKPASPISNDEAAEMIAEAVADDFTGLTTLVTQSAEWATEAIESVSSGRQQACNFSDEGAEEFSTDPGDYPAFSFSFSYVYVLVCDGDEPSHLEANSEFGMYANSQEGMIDFEGSASLSVHGLQESDASFLVNGTLTRNGEFDVKGDDPVAGTMALEINYDDVTVSKEIPHDITDGTATVNFSGSITGKGSFSTTATVTFNGDGTANITVNGQSYNLNLEDGEVTRR